jgi:hypothetical protein
MTEMEPSLYAFEIRKSLNQTINYFIRLKNSITTKPYLSSQNNVSIPNEQLSMVNNDSTNMVSSIIQPIQNKSCGLCGESSELNFLKCNHIICEGCLDTQLLYTNKPCFICLGIKWNTNKSENSALDEYSRWRLKQNKINGYH